MDNESIAILIYCYLIAVSFNFVGTYLLERIIDEIGPHIWSDKFDGRPGAIRAAILLPMLVFIVILAFIFTEVILTARNYQESD